MAQLVCMDARLDTFSDELCQVNTHVGRITRWQVVIGGFIASSPSSVALEDEGDDDGSGSDDAAVDEDVSSSSGDEMATWFTYPLSPVTKRGSSFGTSIVVYIGGELA